MKTGGRKYTRHFGHCVHSTSIYCNYNNRYMTDHRPRKNNNLTLQDYHFDAKWFFYFSDTPKTLRIELLTFAILFGYEIV